MPRYTYKCSECESVLEVVHSMGERLTKCEDCSAETLNRIPAILTKKRQDVASQPGDKVKTFIEETREDIRKEKKNLRSREYKT